MCIRDRHGTLGAPAIVAPAEPPVPENVEEQARDMILAGRRPPIAWRPFIRSLNFRKTELASLEPLSDLTTLTDLVLWKTKIRDISILAGLTGLQSLDMTATQLADVTPLARLTGLQALFLSGTRVADVVPLTGLNLSLIHIFGRVRPGRAGGAVRAV